MPKVKTTFETNIVDLKLTSVEVIPELLIEFKKECVDNPLISVKKLLNRGMLLYLNDPEFKDKILSCTDLVSKGRL
jgi:hypothetical protein